LPKNIATLEISDKSPTVRLKFLVTTGVLMKSMIIVLMALIANLAIARPDQSQTETEFDPFHPEAMEQLEEFDRAYREENGMDFDFGSEAGLFTSRATSCYRLTCDVYALIDKSKQVMFLYYKGKLVGEWKVSTGKEGKETPNMDQHPNGRIYDKYSSRAHPGGDYNGLGNMPYAVFVRGPFAIHGTPSANWPKLGTRASKGCIRLHPDHAKYFNRLVRTHGIFETWITVTD
jgi:hypothetical protein